MGSDVSLAVSTGAIYMHYSARHLNYKEVELGSDVIAVNSQVDSKCLEKCFVIIRNINYHRIYCSQVVLIKSKITT